MRTHDSESLLTQLRKGLLSPADLTGEQFQSIIFQKLLEKCVGEADFEFELLDDYQGVVDFVVRERPRKRSLFHVDDPLHMFECKYYRRTLELSTVAKLLIAGVRFQPSSLNVVSGTSLQPQVYEYARLLFNGLGNRSAMFQRTFFRYFRTSELLGWDIDFSPARPSPEAQEKLQRSKKLGDISWEVIESRPFFEKLVVDSTSPSKEIAVSPQWNYKLRVSLLTSAPPDKIRVWLDATAGLISLDDIRLDSINIDSDRSLIRFSQNLNILPRSDRASENLLLHAKYASKEHHVFTIPFSIQPDIERDEDFSAIHADEAVIYSRSLERSLGPRLLFLGGEAGVGKTYLCELIAKTLQNTTDFQTNRFSINQFEESSILTTIFVALCTPALARTNPISEWRQLADQIFAALVNDRHSETGSNPRPIESSELMVPVLNEFLAKSGPRLLVLRDLHLIGEKAARELMELITRLDDQDWGDLYCIFEYRSSEQNENPHWSKLRLGLQTRINRCERRQITSLSLPQLDKFLDGSFVQISEELKSTVWNCSGGVPLYFFNLLDLLTRQGAIEKVDDDRWVVKRPSLFKGYSTTDRRTDGVLEERLRSIAWTNLPTQFRECPLLLLALIAVAESAERVSRLFEYLNLKIDELRSFRRTLLHYKVIRPSDDQFQYTFQHDLLRKISIEVGTHEEGRRQIVDALVESSDETTASTIDLELLADLAIWARFTEDAVKYLNFAYERAKKRGNFMLTTRLLQKLCQELERNAFDSAQNYTQYLSSRAALAWARWNTGSLEEATDEYGLLESEALSGIDKVIDSDTARSFAADAQRRKAGLCLELDDLPELVRSCRSALDLNGSSIVINSILNRLVLCCALYNFPADGLEFANMALGVLGSGEAENAGAVICSDIGAIFRSESPADALRVYRRALKFGCDGRQQIHNELNVFITEACLQGRIIEDSEFGSWRQRLSENELRAMLVRVDLFQGAYLLRSRRPDEASSIYARAETSIGIYRYEHLILPFLNDAMFAAMLSGEMNQAEKLHCLLVARVNRNLERRAAEGHKLRELMPFARRQLDRFPQPSRMDLKLPSMTPVSSGVLPLVLENLARLDQFQKGKKKPFKSGADLWAYGYARNDGLIENGVPGDVIEIDDLTFRLCAQ